MNTRRTAFALAAGLVCQAAAFAQSAERPWYVGATQDFTYLSNVLITSSGEISDVVSTTSLRGGFNQPFGRQRAFANVALNHQSYRDLSERNSNGYNVEAGLDWSTVERLSGTVRWYSNRRQAAYNVGGIVPISLSNIERTDDLEFRARLGVVTALGFEAAVGHRRLRFGAPEFAAREYNQDNGSFGIVYRPSGILSLNTGVSGSRTRNLFAEVGQSGPDRNRRRDVYVGANWVPTGASTVDARLSYGKQQYDRATSADFSGLTGYARWVWKPTGRLELQTSLSRDISQDAGFLRLDQNNNLQSGTDFAQTTNQLGVTAKYDLTGKIALTGGLTYSKRRLVEGFTGAVGRDNTTAGQIGFAWAATRTLSAGCGAGRESRSGSGTGTADYTADRFNCFGSVTLD
jgi:Putative beta-barrel porin 2